VRSHGRPPAALPTGAAAGAGSGGIAANASHRSGFAGRTGGATQPARQPEPAPAPPATKPAVPEPAKPAPQPTLPPAKSAAASASSEAPAGSFWQVTAKANKESAQATLKILKERGFSAYLTPGPNNLTRVLVGPFKDTPSKAKAKTDLEAMGFKPIKLDRE